MLENANGFVPAGWISGTEKNTLRDGKPIPVLPSIPAGSVILGITVLPIHIYDNDPHPEPFSGLLVEFTNNGRGFVLQAQSYNPRDSIDFFYWQVTYGQAPKTFQPRGWLSGATTNAVLPQKIETQAPLDAAIAGVTILPIHVYDNDPNPEPWPGLEVDFTQSNRIFLSSNGSGPRDRIDWFMWQALLGPLGAVPPRIGWLSGVTRNAELPARITPNVPQGYTVVSAMVLPIHVSDNDPKPEPWPGLRVDFPAPDTFTIRATTNDPRDRIDWFMWQVTIAAIG